MANIKKRALSVEKPAVEKDVTVPKQNQNKKKKLAVTSNEQTKAPNKVKKPVANGKVVSAENANKKAAKQNQKQKSDKVAPAPKKKQEPKKVIKGEANSAEQVNKKAKPDAAKSQNKEKTQEGGKKSRSRKIQYTLEKFTVETLEAKIAEIKSKETLSKTAKRRLAALKKLLRVKQGGDGAVNASGDDKQQKGPKKAVNNKVAEAKEKKAVDNKTQQKAKPQVVAVQKVNKVVPAKEGKKVEKVLKPQKKNLLVKSVKPEEEDDDEDSEPEDDEINAINDSTDAVVNSEEDDSEDDDVDDEEEEDDDDDDEDKVTDKVKSQQPPKKAETKDDKSGKQQRYVLFLGNLPYNVKPEDIKKHFLSKCSSVVSVRIPQKKGTDKPQGFGYIEFSNSEDYEKGLTFHNTFLGGRKLNVQYTTTGSKHISSKQDVVAKNKKLQALRQTGKLAGSKPNKNFAKKQRKA